MKQRLQQLLQRIAIACEQAQREPQSVRLLPVSKTFSHELVQQAIMLGLTRFGENRIQDIRSRYEYFAEQPVQWVMIGHAQTNKARDIARYADELQSLDRLALAEALQRRLDGEQRCLPVYIQVKTAQEDSKFGLDPSQLMPFLAQLKHFDRLQPQGLMTMATQTDDPKEIRRCFAQLRLLRDQAQEAGYENITRLSMGMSGDFELAIAEGATDIRVGSALFGHRA
ncbi:MULTISPECIES: YggS family pyridoxal phosphate-dependent enzyme [Paenalcaligenes]|uniref:Pyridoxal phosphate homeostasis protein n=1 Tax=Paenalcaligenes hermetiae TaxID=1157987 RepID=A0ABP9LWT6_9BURK|nr:YggS family pyridoxal phosphate-dependent enzyme [Paenalcaligenes sp.]